ncbi:hypothetical protein GCM10027271_33810 [Saccharopolyspora gloriosae]
MSLIGGQGSGPPGGGSERIGDHRAREPPGWIFSAFRGLEKSRGERVSDREESRCPACADPVAPHGARTWPIPRTGTCGASARRAVTTS